MVVRLGALAAQLDAESLVQGVTEAARDLTGAQLAMFVPAERAVLTEPTIVCDPDVLSVTPDPARVPLLAGALWRITPVRLDDADEWEPGNAGYGRLSDGSVFRSWVGAPVRARYGDALGGLYLAHHRPNAFGTREEELAQSLAAHLGASLDNLTVFQERSRVAQALQQTLLPPVLPEVAGPGRCSPVPPSKVNFLGRRGLLRHVRGALGRVGLDDRRRDGGRARSRGSNGDRCAMQRARSPHRSTRRPRLLTQLNETLVGFGLQDRFCTVLYAELHPGPDVLKVKIANGGHPYPYILRSDGQCRGDSYQRYAPRPFERRLF